MQVPAHARARARAFYDKRRVWSLSEDNSKVHQETLACNKNLQVGSRGRGAAARARAARAVEVSTEKRVTLIVLLNTPP